MKTPLDDAASMLTEWMDAVAVEFAKEFAKSKQASYGPFAPRVPMDERLKQVVTISGTAEALCRPIRV